MNLFEILTKTVNLYPDKIALIINEKKYSYTEIFHEVKVLADEFSRLGLSKKNVGIVYGNSLEFILTLIALSKIDSTIFLLNPLNYLNDFKIEKELNIEILLIEKKWNSLIKISNEYRLDYEVNLNNAVVKYYQSSHKKYGIGIIQSSSGSTGKPKYAFRTYENILEDLGNINQTFMYDCKDMIYSPVPLCHGYGLTMGLLSSIYSGSSLVLAEDCSLVQFRNIHRFNKISIYLLIPDMLELLNNHCDDLNNYFNDSRIIFCSGEPLQQEIGEKFYQSINKNIVQLYGMMEVSTIAANYPSNKLFRNCVGTNVKGVKVKIDEHSGELLVSSKTISPFYVSPYRRIEKVDGEWFRTGDLAEFNESGELCLKGRIRNEININVK